MGKLKRCLAGLLAVATVLSSSNIAYAAQGLGTDADGKTVYKATVAESVAIHYELSDAEKAVLESDAIVQGVLPNAELPTGELVTVDSINKVVIAKELIGANNAYKWVPILATTKLADEAETVVDEVIKFNEPVNGEYTSMPFTATGAYVVHVNYALEYNVSVEEQIRVLGIPQILAEGMTYMNRLGELSNDLSLFQDEEVFGKVLEAKAKIEDTVEEKRAEAYEEAKELAKEEAYEEAKKLAKEEAYEEAKELAKEEAYEEAKKLAKEEAYEEAKELAKEEAYEEAKELAKEEAYEEAKKLAKEEAYEEAYAALEDEVNNNPLLTTEEQKKEALKKLVEEKLANFDAEYEKEFAENKAEFDATFEEEFAKEFEENKAEFDATFEEEFAKKFEENKAEFDATFEEEFTKKFAENKAEFDATFEEEFAKKFEENKAEFDATFEEEFAKKFAENKAEFDATFEEEFAKKFAENKEEFDEKFEEEFEKELNENYSEIPAVIAAIDALDKDIDDGGLDYYGDITVSVGAKLPFFINKQATISGTNNAILKEHFGKIAEFISNPNYADYVTGYGDIVNTLNDIIAELTFFATPADTSALKAVLATDVEGNIYESNVEFENLVSALTADGVALKANGITPVENVPLIVYRDYDVVKAVDAATIQITAKAYRASEVVDDFELKELEVGVKNITLAKDLTEKQIKEQIDLAVAELLNGKDDEVGMIAKWKEAGYDVENEEESVYQDPEYTDEYPKQLEADRTYKYGVSYKPNLYRITNDYMEQQTAYHGTTIKLPEYAGRSVTVYEYKVWDNSSEVRTYESYNQGAEITVLHDMEIERSLAERTFERLLNILQKEKTDEFVKSVDAKPEEEAQAKEDANATVKAILESNALKSPSVSIIYPSADVVDPVKKHTVEAADGSTYDEHYAKAINVLTGIDGMIWEPIDAVLIKKNAEGEDEALQIKVNYDDYKNADSENVIGKVFSWVPGETDYDYLRVNYQLKISTILEDNKYVTLDDAKLKTYLNLANNVVDEVGNHKTILEDKIDLVYRNITGTLKTVMNTAVLGEIKGKLSDGEGKGNEAIEEILAANTGSKLNLYTYLEECCPPLLSEEEIAEGKTRADYDVANYLYNSYYTKIREEAIFLAPYLRAIAGDVKLGDVLGEYNITVNDSLRRQIYDFAEKLDGIKVNADGTLTDTQTGGLKNTIKDLSDDILVADQIQFATLINNIVDGIIEEGVVLKDFTDEDAAKGVYANWSGTSNAPGKISITVSVTGPKGNVSKVQPLTVNDDETFYALNSNDAVKVAAIYEAAKLEAGITAENAIFYEYSTEEEIPGEGYKLDLAEARAFYYSYIYQARTFEEPVLAKGVEVGRVSFSVDTPVFELAALDDTNYKYVYTITETVDDKEVVTTVDCANNTSKTYAVKNLRDIALGNDTLKIVRSKYSLATDTIDKIVNLFNEGLVGAGASFVKVKDYSGEADNGTYKAIVMSMDAAVKLEALMAGFGKAMANVAFETDYIGFGADGSDAFMTRIGEDGTQVMMQSMINLLLNSDISLKKIADMSDANGTIRADKNLTFDKAYIVSNNKALGGELVKSGIKFGEGEALPFYITLAGKNSETLKSIKNVHDSYGNNLSVGTKEGSVFLDATMPEKVYALYMSVMLMTGVIDEKDLGDVEPSLEEQIHLLRDQLELNFLDEVNHEVIENTINTYLYNGEGEAVDLTPYASLIDSLIDLIDKIINNEDGVYNGNPTIEETKSEGGQYAFDMTYDIAGMLANVDGIGDFVGFLGENTKIKIPMSFTVLNISAGVEAIVLDWSQSGLNKLRYIDSVAEYLNAEVNDEHKTSGPVYVYLLEDIGAADGASILSIDVPTVLNLNGHKVLTDIQANAELRIVDSEIDDAKTGAVYGEIFGNGNNVRIAAGNYPVYGPEPPYEPRNPEEFASMLREGYILDGETVVSEYYSISKNEESKTIDVAISTDLAGITEGNMQTLALDVISDLVFNVYTIGKVAVDGNTLFDAETEGLMDDFTGFTDVAKKLTNCVNIPNIKGFANDVLADFSDFERLANLVENGGVVSEFDLTTANWGVKTRLLGDEENGKYIGIELATDEEDTYHVRFQFKNQNPELAYTLRKFKDLITLKRSFNYEGIEISSGGVNIKGSMEFRVLADLSQNIENDPQKSSDYVTAIAAVLAYSVKDEAQRKEIITAIIDYENNIYAGALEDEIDKITVRQFIDAIKAAAEKTQIDTDEEGNPIYERISFSEILDDLGLRNKLVDTVAVEACYAPVLDIAYNLVHYAEAFLNKLDSATSIEIYGNALGSSRIKHVEEVIDEETGKTLFVKTYGGLIDRPFDKAITIEARMKLFSENYVPPVDEAINALNALDEYQEYFVYDAEGKIIDIVPEAREALIEDVAAARAAYDALAESMKKYVDEELYNKLLQIENVYNTWGVWVAPLDEDEIEYNYSGKAHKPVDEVHVYDGAKRLTYKTDYTLSYQYNVNAADADSAKAPRVIVKLRKNYTGTVYAYFTINQIELAKAWPGHNATEEEWMAAQEYADSVGLRIDDVYATATSSTKATNFKKPVVYLNGKKVSTAEYGLFYNENPTADKTSVTYKEAGCSYPITVYGKGKNFAAPEYKDVDGIQVPTGYVAFQHVASYMMSKVSVAKIANQPYNFGEEVKLETAVYGEGQIAADKKNNGKLVVTYGSGKNKLYLYEGVHFITDYMNNVDAGTATITLVGTGMSEKSYVESYNLEHPDAPITTPENGVEFDTRSFTGTKTIKFKIVASQKLTSSMVKLLTLQQKTNETGEIIEELVPLKKGYIQKTYTGTEIQLNNAAYAGNAGDYNVEATVTKVDEEGNKITETVLLEEGKDYIVTYKKNTNKGTATATFKGIGNYAGTVNKSFKIVAAPIDYLLVTDPDIEVAYQKNGVKPASEIILKNSNTNLAMKNGKDYTLSFANTTKVATEIDGEYVYVNPKAANTDNYIIPRQDINARLMDKETNNPVSKSELSVANKYMPKVVIKGKGNYTGTITLYYAITPADLEEVGATITAKDVKYSTKNNNWATTVTLKDVNGKTLKRGSDYLKDYEYFVKTGTKVENGKEVDVFEPVTVNTNIKAGTKMQVKVTGKGNYTGSLTAEYYIYATPINTSKTTITLTNFSSEYDKYEKKPEIKVTYRYSKTNIVDLVEGEDYIVLASNYKQNTFVGTAKITIKGIGEFSGTKAKTFRILQFKQDRVNLTDESINLVNKDIIVDYQKGGVKPAKQIVLEHNKLTSLVPLALVEGRDYKLTWYNTTKVATEMDGEYVYGYTNKAKEFVEVTVPDQSLATTNTKLYKSQVSLANKYMPRVRITGLGNYKGYVDVYYTITPADLAAVAELTAKDVKWANKNANYKPSVTVIDNNGKKLASNTDFKINKYYIWTVLENANKADEKWGWADINNYIGSTVAIDRADGSLVEVEVTSKGKIVLAKGQSVKMMVDAYGIKGYKDTVISDDYVIKR